MASEDLQPTLIEDIGRKVAALRETFEQSGDVTTQEFMRISQTRDDLVDLIRLMYEKCIYKDD